MRKFILTFCIFSLLYLFSPLITSYTHPYIVLNMCNIDALPKKFRKINTLNASGSAQFSEKSLRTLIKDINYNHLTIIDLRQESHGFINGNAISWYKPQNDANKNLSLKEITKKEKSLIDDLSKQLMTIIYLKKKIPTPVLINNASTEQMICHLHNIDYMRLSVTDHERPLDQTVDLFISFIKNFDENNWLHFHCEAGVGRTTTFLIMLDCMRNAKNTSFETIAKRQQALANVNLLNVPNDYRKDYAEKRLLFLQQFYTYCEKNPNFNLSWSDWIQSDQSMN